MDTKRSDKMYACVETVFSSGGDDVDVFNGTHKECLKWMSDRFKAMSKELDYDKDTSWIEKECGLGHAVMQSGCGEFRYEWYVVIPNEKRGEENKVWTVVFPYGEERERKFDDEKKLVHWLKTGMYSCDGAERDHYVNMLAEYDAGETTLHY